MAGFTGITTGNIHGKSCYIPLDDVLRERRTLGLNDSDWQKLLTSTGQPTFLNHGETVPEKFRKESVAKEAH